MTSAGAQIRAWQPRVEAVGVFFLLMLYIWKLRLLHPWLWLPLLAFVIWTHISERESPRYLGFGWKEFRAAAPRVLPWVAAISAVTLAVGVLLGTMRPATSADLARGAAIYIFWGLFQQYVLNGFFVNRLAGRAGPPGRFVPLAAAALFSLAHLPNWFLMAVTFAGGYASARVYLRFRSLYVLAIAHGLIAMALYLVVPDSISAHFVIGPRYLLDVYGIFPEFLL